MLESILLIRGEVVVTILDGFFHLLLRADRFYRVAALRRVSDYVPFSSEHIPCRINSLLLVQGHDGSCSGDISEGPFQIIYAFLTQRECGGGLKGVFLRKCGLGAGEGRQRPSIRTRGRRLRLVLWLIVSLAWSAESRTLSRIPALERPSCRSLSFQASRTASGSASFFATRDPRQAISLSLLSLALG